MACYGPAVSRTKSQQRTIAGLECRIVDALPDDTPPTLLVVLCHGYGAPGDDLVSIGGELLRASSLLAQRARFIFPSAPIVLGRGYGMESRAWWPIDMEALDDAIRRGAILDRSNESPPELPQVRAQLRAMLDELCAETGLPLTRVALGGFSQGSMLTTDLALHLETNPAALGIFSGTLIHAARWRELAPARRGLPVMQSHGRHDPLLAFEAAEALRDLLQAGGLEIQFIPFDGPHTIVVEALFGWMRLLESVASG